MAQDFTTTALLASVKRRGMLPSSDQTFTTADLLAFGTEELQTYVMSLLLSANEDYGTASYDLTLVTGTNTYALPVRASNEALRNVLLLDSTVYTPLLRVTPSDVPGTTSSGTPNSYYFFDDTLVVVPTPSAASTVRLQYFRRPSALVLPAAAATISSINVARTIITTTATIPSTMTSGVILDVVSHSPGFRIQSMDAVTTGTVSGTTITVATALPSSVVAGNYVCLTGESCVPQIPVEAHPLLAQRIVVKALEALGDKKVDAAEKACERMSKSLLARLMPRSTGSVQYIVGSNGPGFGRRGGR